MPRCWFDAHLDLAYLAVRGRDMRRDLGGEPEDHDGPHPPAAVTLNSLNAGRVCMALGTIFTEPVGSDGVEPGPEQYAAGNAELAYRRGRAQLEVYLTWRDQGLVRLDRFAALREDAGVGEVRAGMGVSQVVPESIGTRVRRMTQDARLHLGILMENADPIRTPAELSWWVSQGVVAVGLTWARSSRYATGNGVGPEERVGLTSDGVALIAEMDRLGVVHDVSHLSDRALEGLFEHARGAVMASHSNCRALLDRPGAPANQRHLTDGAIREVVRRGGVIGLNLYSPFLARGGVRDRRATIDEAIAHVERVCELAGDRRHTGLGSDMDGGFGADQLPAGVQSPVELRRLSDALLRRDWSDEDIHGFMWKNWAEFWARQNARV